MNDEDELRRAFTKLKEHDARRAPRFDQLVERGKPRPARSPWAVVVPLASAAAAAAVFLFWCSTQSMTASSPPTAAAPAPAADQPAAAAKQVAFATPQAAGDREPLGFLLTLPGATAVRGSDQATSFLLPGR